MTNPIKEEVKKDQLEAKSVQLNDADLKQAKKLTKKKNIPPEIAEHIKFTEKNKPGAIKLINDFETKLADLGFTLKAVIQVDPQGNGIFPKQTVMPLSPQQFAEHIEKQN